MEIEDRKGVQIIDGNSYHTEKGVNGGGIQYKTLPS